MSVIAFNASIIKELHSLQVKVGSAQSFGFHSRVQFVKLAYRHNLVRAITTYQLWDQGYEGLGERTFDTCFEMGDSQEVICELITDARRHGYLANIEREIGNADCFARWCSYADRQGVLSL